MDYKDAIEEKRKLAEEKTEQAREAKDQKDTLKAIADGSSKVVAEVARQSSRTRTATQKTTVENLPDLALRQDIDKVVDGLKNLETKLKPEGVDFAPVIKALSSLGADLKAIPQKFPKQPDTFKITNLNEVVDAINKQELTTSYNPTIEVSPTPVTVETKDIDIDPLVEAINSLKEEPEETEFEFEKYVAQDLDSDSPDFQYVGMVNPEGGWCFIENDRQGNTLRFVVGQKNYRESWTKHMEFEYRTLDEAVDGIRA
jgi:hypothetical protein